MIIIKFRMYLVILIRTNSRNYNYSSIAKLCDKQTMIIYFISAVIESWNTDYYLAFLDYIENCLLKLNEFNLMEFPPIVSVLIISIVLYENFTFNCSLWKL